MDATLLLKVSVLLAATLLLSGLLRQAPPITRHRYWSFVFGAILFLPFLTLALPPLDVPIHLAPEPTAGRAVQPRNHISTHTESPGEGTVKSEAAASMPLAEQSGSVTPAVAAAPSLRTAMLTAWGIGTCVAIASLLISLLRVRRLSHGASEVDDPSWQAATIAIGVRLGYRRSVRVALSEHVTTPMAGGVWRPTVFLPASCHEWRAEHRDVVLAHEIAHLASCDPLRHLIARLAVGIYWFHPLAWIAARQAGVAREEACDAAVLALGTRPSMYARVLLDLAESMQRRPGLLAALPMVQHSRLERRLMVILRDTRPAARRLAAVPIVVAGLFTLAVAAAQPGGIAPSPVPAVIDMDAGTVDRAPAPVASADATGVAAVPTSGAQVNPASECWRGGIEGSFSGSLSMGEVGGRTVIYEQVGTRGTSRVIQKTFDDLRLCLVAEEVGDRRDAGMPSQWLGAASRFLMEARHGASGKGSVQQLEGERQAGGGYRVTWRTDGRERPFDSAGERWRDRMLAVFDTTWELSALRGEVSSLRGEISSIRGEESSRRGEISALRGEVSSMRGRISSLRGEESSLRGQISSIAGHVSSLRGEISAARGAISSLNADRYRASDAERASIAAGVSRHETAIALLEKEIRDYNADAKIAALEREIASHDFDGMAAAIEAEIRAFDVEGKVAEVERRIAALDVSGKIAAIERKISALDADRRGRQLESRRDVELKQLEAAIAAIR